MASKYNMPMLAILTLAVIAGAWATSAATTADSSPPAKLAQSNEGALATSDAAGTRQGQDATSAATSQTAHQQDAEAQQDLLEDFQLRVTGNTGSGIHEKWTIPVEESSFDTLEVLVTIEDPGEIIDWAIQCVEAILEDAAGEQIARGTAQEEDGLLFTEDETVQVLHFSFADLDLPPERLIGDWTLHLHSADSNLVYSVAADVLYGSST